jgi:4-oxalocrotonate tautomerase
MEGNNMPVIQVNILEGRTDEQKENLIRKVTDVVAETLNSPTSAVRIIINEMKPQHFGRDGQSIAKEQATKKS